MSKYGKGKYGRDKYGWYEINISTGQPLSQIKQYRLRTVSSLSRESRPLVNASVVFPVNGPVTVRLRANDSNWITQQSTYINGALLKVRVKAVSKTGESKWVEAVTGTARNTRDEAWVNLYLQNLLINTGGAAFSQVPRFNKKTSVYTINNIPEEVTNTRIRAMAEDSKSTISINGQTVVSGETSATIPLEIGENIINVHVSTPLGVEPLQYNIYVIRSSIALLESLSVDGLPFVFNNHIYGYQLTTTSDTINVIPVVADTEAEIYIGEIKVESGVASSVSLVQGPNTVEISVRPKVGTDYRVYSIYIYKE